MWRRRAATIIKQFLQRTNAVTEHPLCSPIPRWARRMTGGSGVRYINRNAWWTTAFAWSRLLTSSVAAVTCPTPPGCAQPRSFCASSTCRCRRSSLYNLVSTINVVSHICLLLIYVIISSQWMSCVSILLSFSFLVFFCRSMESNNSTSVQSTRHHDAFVRVTHTTRSQAVARIADRTAKNCKGHVT